VIHCFNVCIGSHGSTLLLHTCMACMLYSIQGNPGIQPADTEMAQQERDGARPEVS
jgi:hypothetical protein